MDNLNELLTDLEDQLTATELREIAQTDELDSVTEITLSINTDSVTVSNLNSLLPNLVELKFETPTYIPSLRKLGTLQNLQILWASAVGLENIEGTSGFPNLIELYISYNQVSDLSPLTFLPNLEVLDLESNQIESGLDLRYLSFCEHLKSVSFSGCPIALLPDYRKIVLKRLPPNSLLDDAPDEILDYDSQDKIDHNALINAEDANLLKELVADGLLDATELLENEPVSRPFTAMGMRPKTTNFTPFHRPSSAFKRPSTSGRQRSADSTDLTRGGASPAHSTLTKGGVIQGSRGLLNRRPNSAGVLSESTTTRGHERERKANEKQMKIEMEEKLKNWNREASGEVNILKLDDNQDEEIVIPARSTIAVNIRGRTTTPDPTYSDSEEPELQDKLFNPQTIKREIQSRNDHEPKIMRKVSNSSLSSGYQSQSPSDRKPLNALRGNPRPLKATIRFEDIRDPRISSRQETLLAEGRELKQVIGAVPIIKPHKPKSTNTGMTQN